MTRKEIPPAARNLEERLDGVLVKLTTVNTLRQLLRVHTEHCERGDDCAVAVALRERLQQLKAR